MQPKTGACSSAASRDREPGYSPGEEVVVIASLVDSLGIISPGMWAYTYTVALMTAWFIGIGVPALAVCAGLNKWRRV